MMTATAATREALALHGGTPVRATLLPYGRQTISEDDIQAVVEALRSDWLTTGPKINEFEEAFAAWVGARYAISFSSGTAALHGAAFAARIGPGDHAVSSPLTFSATANCILYQRATPTRCENSVITASAAMRETASTKVSGTTKWSCWDSITA